MSQVYMYEGSIAVSCHTPGRKLGRMRRQCDLP
jgi:hypothetical protein